VSRSVLMKASTMALRLVFLMALNLEWQKALHLEKVLRLA
jgi:hypothetical protein